MALVIKHYVQFAFPFVRTIALQVSSHIQTYLIHFLFYLKQTNATHIIYKNSVEYLPTHISGSVMHSNTYIFKLQCEFPRNVIDNGRPIIPLTETVTQTAEGSFKVDMQFWT